MARMMRASTARLAVIACALAVLAGEAAKAQPPAAPPPQSAADESAVVQELEVIGRRPGPALWRVTEGDSEVVIVGGLSPLPHALQWDEARVRRAMDGASVLFLPPTKAHIGLFDAPGMIFRLGALKPARGADMEAALPPDLRARFERVRDRYRLDPKRYQHWKPAVAGLMLVGDFRRAASLSSDKPGTTLARMAEASHVQVRTVGAVNAKTLFDAFARMSDAQHRVCLSAALDDVEAEAVHAATAADAWARGDLNAARANASASLLDECLLQLPTVQALMDRGASEAVTAIDEALKRPGRSVALVDLAFLLRPNGVLDRLKAQGAQITLPP